MVSAARVRITVALPFPVGHLRAFFFSSSGPGEAAAAALNATAAAAGARSPFFAVSCGGSGVAVCALASPTQDAQKALVTALAAAVRTLAATPCALTPRAGGWHALDGDGVAARCVCGCIEGQLQTRWPLAWRDLRIQSLPLSARCFALSYTLTLARDELVATVSPLVLRLRPPRVPPAVDAHLRAGRGVSFDPTPVLIPPSFSPGLLISIFPADDPARADWLAAGGAPRAEHQLAFGEVRLAPSPALAQGSEYDDLDYDDDAQEVPPSSASTRFVPLPFICGPGSGVSPPGAFACDIAADFARSLRTCWLLGKQIATVTLAFDSPQHQPHADVEDAEAMPLQSAARETANQTAPGSTVLRSACEAPTGVPYGRAAEREDAGLPLRIAGAEDAAVAVAVERVTVRLEFPPPAAAKPVVVAPRAPALALTSRPSFAAQVAPSVARLPTVVPSQPAAPSAVQQPGPVRALLKPTFGAFAAGSIAKIAPKKAPAKTTGAPVGVASAAAAAATSAAAAAGQRPPAPKKRKAAEAPIDGALNDADVRRRHAAGEIAKCTLPSLKAFLKHNQTPGGLAGVKAALLERVLAHLSGGGATATTQA